MPFNFQRLEHVRIAVALVAAVVTGGAAIYGVHSNAREATEASYETLAPEINELKQAVGRLEAENQALRQAMAARGQPDDVRSRAAPAAEARSAPRRPRASGSPAGAGTSGTGAPVPTEPPTQAPPPSPPPPEPAPAPGPGGVLEDIQKRVPIDFEKAREVWKKVKDVRTAPPPR